MPKPIASFPLANNSNLAIPCAACSATVCYGANTSTTGEQQQFGDTVRRLLSDGLLWYEHEHDRSPYNFLVRRRELVADYLSVAGWELRSDERLSVFHVVHRDGAHRRRLTRDTTIWLLLLRLIYAEKYERVEVRLTRYPTISVEALYQCYTELLPGQAVKKKTSLQEALRTLQSLKLIRAGGLQVENPADCYRGVCSGEEWTQALETPFSSKRKSCYNLVEIEFVKQSF